MPDKLGIAIHFFGGVAVSINGVSVGSFSTARARDLFCFLALNKNQYFTREYLADLLWPDRGSTQSQGSLRTEMWRIRSTFGRIRKDAGALFAENASAVRFSPQFDCWIDIEEFDTLLSRRGKVPPTSESLLAASSLYKGDLLCGLDAEWCVYHRELYRIRYLSALELLINSAINECRWIDAIELGTRFLIQDPFAEHVHVALMKCYCQAGHRAAAVRQFEMYRQRLADAFSMQPLPETIALCENIRRHDRGGRNIESSSPTLIHHQDDIEHILRAVDTMRRHVGQAAASFEASIAHLVYPRPQR